MEDHDNQPSDSTAPSGALRSHPSTGLRIAPHATKITLTPPSTPTKSAATPSSFVPYRPHHAANPEQSSPDNHPRDPSASPVPQSPTQAGVNNPPEHRLTPVITRDVRGYTVSAVPHGDRRSQFGLRVSASTSAMRSQRPSPFGRETLPTAPLSAGHDREFFSHPYSPELHFDQFPRSSLRSALTSSSSIEHASATERSSSVLTKDSSIPDVPALSAETNAEADGEAEFEFDEGMTVDEAISMYLDGFSDDPPDDLGSLEEDLTAVDDGQKSIKTLTKTQTEEAVTHNVDPSEGVVMRPPSNERHSFYALSSPMAPPPLSPETPLRDVYGFKKSTFHISLDTYESWNRRYSTYSETRRRKWAQLLKSYELPHVDLVAFPLRSAKVKRYIRKGIPPEYRGAVWFWYAGGHEQLEKNGGVYNRLVESAFEAPTNDDKEHIERDLHRTFPDNIHFKPDPLLDSDLWPLSESATDTANHDADGPETRLIQSLRRVLYAFSIHNTKIGYTQSLNFLAGLLLIFLPEEKAFWLLDIITSTYFPATHEISLEGANVDLWILMVTLRESMPAVYSKATSSPRGQFNRTRPPPITADTRLPDITLGVTSWLMSLFIGSLPIETILRVWDVLFYEGPRTFFRVTLAIFKMHEKEILACTDPMEIFQIVQAAPKKLLDANALIDLSFSRKFRLTHDRVEKLRAARRKAIREEKELVSFLASRGNMNAQ